jgi:RNA polymerase sigma factor (TIGR02999 family)
MGDVTRILDDLQRGERQAADQLLPLVYEELRALAAQKLAREQPGQTLQPTALVHEAYLRLVGPGNAAGFEGRRHFFAAAAEAMRRLLVEAARRKRGPKAGGSLERADIDLDRLAAMAPPVDLVALNDALDRLAAEAPARAELVKLRYFAGLTIPEAADVLGVSVATAERYWTFARTWLYAELGDAGAEKNPPDG